MAGLYVHIPFCGQRCAYCDFYKSTDARRTGAFLAALGREMELRRDRFHAGESGYGGAGGDTGNGTGDGGHTGGGTGAVGRVAVNPHLDTIYIGGGTPSVLSPGQLQAVLDRAAELWECSRLREVTVEANPEDLSGDYLARLADTRFDRLSVGIQSFDDGLLRLMNRRHSAQRATEAIKSAQRAGFRNITIDLIYGIPGMTLAQWERTLDEAVALGVQHVSAYHLTIEPGTAFGKRAARDERSTSPSAFRPIPEAESERQYELLRERLLAAGMEQYEISNFALPGHRAVHNSAYWSGERYWGVGPSAHSFDGGRRREWVTADLEKYIAALSDPADPAAALYDGETLTDADVRNERVMTALRTAEGIAECELPRTPPLEKLLAEGLLVRHGGRVAIPPEQFLLSDYVIASLFE